MRKQLKVNLILILTIVLLGTNVGYSANIIPETDLQHKLEIQDSIEQFGVYENLSIFQRRRIEKVIQEVVDTVDADLSEIDFIIPTVKLDGIGGYYYDHMIIICTNNTNTTEIRDIVLHEIGHYIEKQRIDKEEYKTYYPNFEFSNKEWETKLNESIAEDYRLYAIDKYYNNIATREKKTRNKLNKDVFKLFEEVK